MNAVYSGVGDGNEFEPNMMSKQVYERKKLKQDNRQPWTSSKKMHYLRLSKGIRKPTASELQASINNSASAPLISYNQFGNKTSNCKSEDRGRESFMSVNAKR